jgi:predicted esterase
MPASPPPADTLHFPRILCLHGGGTNAQIFDLQTRTLQRYLKSRFRLCFADAPFTCNPGTDVTAVFSDCGPFRRWMRWLPDHGDIDAEYALKAINESISDAIKADDALGATGEFVALMGFSQGSQIAASLLYRQQVRESLNTQSLLNFRFAVLMAGRGPLVQLEPNGTTKPGLVDPSQMLALHHPVPGKSDAMLHKPTLHVHGLLDEGLTYHRQLLEYYCEKGSARLIEWNGPHRVPVIKAQVEKIVEQVIEMAKETGVFEK